MKIHRIQKICKDYGIVPPVYEEMADEFGGVLFNEKLEVTEQATKNVTENREQLIVKLIQDNSQP
ncbi:MAG TPA: hypothetical protein PKA53_07970 [Sphingobacterium sp.]|nr:hypothetical protein [Sphingobacterium sp.]